MFQRPTIAILLATHNGARFINEQLDSLLAQQGINVRVVVSDDASTDETVAIVMARARTDKRIVLLTPGQFGSAASNFYRLIRDADVAGCDGIAFSDQDDLWEPWKLRHHFRLLMDAANGNGEASYAAVSSNVASFDATGKSRLVVKNQRQRTADFLFESGGPGSTFLLAPKTFAFVRGQLSSPSSPAAHVQAHDWCIYALVRARGWQWFVDSQPSVRYRQHEDNVLGANEGLSQHLARLRQIMSGQYRADVERVCKACLPVACEPAHIEWVLNRIRENNPLANLRLARQHRHLRRRRRDQLVLAATIMLGLW